MRLAMQLGSGPNQTRMAWRNQKWNLGWAYLCSGQTQAWLLKPAQNSGLVPELDISTYYLIHPEYLYI